LNKESLKKVSDRVHLLVDDPDVPIEDKVELLINILHFLNPEEYEGNIKVLQEHKLQLKRDELE
jgi:hypothetical protein